MITGASLGALGSSRAQAHLRQILDAPEVKARIMPSAEFLLGHSMQAFDEDGCLKDEEKVAELEDCFNEFKLFVEITNRLSSVNIRLPKSARRNFLGNRYKKERK